VFFKYLTMTEMWTGIGVLLSFPYLVQAQNAQIIANPNPIPVVDRPGALGTTNIQYSAPGHSSVTVYVGSGPTGSPFCSGGESGQCETGNWVTNDMEFALVDAGTKQVLATVYVQLNPLGAMPVCSEMDPYTAAVAPGSAQSFSVSGISSGATAVDFIVESPTQTPSTAPSYSGSNQGGGVWSYSVATGQLLGGYKIIAKIVTPQTSSYCQMPGFLTVAPALPNGPGLAVCNSVDGAWTDSSGDPTLYWGLSQSGSGQTQAVTGNLSATSAGCEATTWTVTGTMNTQNGEYSIVASNPDPPGNGACTAVSSFTESNILVQNGSQFCSYAAGTYTAVYGGEPGSGSFYMSKTVPVPDSETTETNPPWASGLTTEAAFSATLNSAAGYGFAGRAVQESTSGTVNDACWYPGSDVEQVTGVTGGSWFVQSVNNYGPDYIGLAPGSIGYYQYYRPTVGLSASCTITVPQRMAIGVKSGGQPVAYGGSQSGNTNTLQISITSTTVSDSRGGVSAQETFGFN